MRIAPPPQCKVRVRLEVCLVATGRAHRGTPAGRTLDRCRRWTWLATAALGGGVDGGAIGLRLPLTIGSLIAAEQISSLVRSEPLGRLSARSRERAFFLVSCVPRLLSCISTHHKTFETIKSKKFLVFTCLSVRPQAKIFFFFFFYLNCTGFPSDFSRLSTFLSFAAQLSSSVRLCLFPVAPPSASYRALFHPSTVACLLLLLLLLFTSALSP